jgi:hypothetical protein
MTRECEIKLVDRKGGGHGARISLELIRSPDATVETPGEERLCRVTLRWSGGEVVGQARDYFTAFCRIREQLEPSGVLPHCYAASRKVILRGIDQDLGAGLMVYRAEIGQNLDDSDRVDIFASGPDVQPATVEEQRAFQALYHGEAWPVIRSLLGW